MRPTPASPRFRHLAGVRADHRDAVGAEAAPRLRCVAGCSHMRGFIAGAISTGLSVASSTARGEIVGMAVRHLGHQVGGRGRDDDEIGVARQPDVADVELGRGVEQVGEGALARRARRPTAA